MCIGNLFSLPEDKLSSEQVDELLKSGRVKIERIISDGQVSPEGFWYDQPENEWVIVLQGFGEVEFLDGAKHPLKPGDCLFIPAHSKHRVSSTSLREKTIWLAFHFPQK